ncbi:NADPH-dependent FMN reductase [Streptomyces zagrosensis]|uniref:NAD(P)H-dependent FMN reductase n=1 Tax=Streptomyces zagrosensis TaxID=1042984 RepID=A0A7W9Q6G8_9ACTN|nr:NAD(P)H-dependent oxidoreductase [Streptomyces zagrosensis]MBB5934401.1 NAD(P)H-dependent FMN reductase [Streptomyces zagrosensis]
MSRTALQLAIIVGSTRGGRFAPVVANWITEQARQHGDLDVNVIDLAEISLPNEMPPYGAAPGPQAAAALAKLTPGLAAADAFIVITPEYNHSYPASLKNAIDWHNAEWHAKPVGFVSYGGISGGLRAVEHLRGVFAELHAVTIRDTVSFPMAGNLFDGEGQLKSPEGPNAAAKALFDQLVWWGRALRNAKEDQPYAA